MFLGLKILTVSASVTNKRAIHVYGKVGFVKTGIIPKKFFKEDKYMELNINDGSIGVKKIWQTLRFSTQDTLSQQRAK
jgi:hypothetical protein